MSHGSSRHMISSIGEFLEQISKLRAETPEPEPEFWFRGQPNWHWELKPTVLRSWFQEQVRERRNGDADEPFERSLARFEAEINGRFIRETAWLLKAGPESPDMVECYFAAQHHGMPTRLLDWSKSAVAALFFAVADANWRHTDGIIFAMQPAMLAGEAPDQPRSRGSYDKRSPVVRTAIEALFVESQAEKATAGCIMPIEPDTRAGRMLQQGSRFTLHLPGCSDIPSSAYRHFVVPNECKGSIQSDLRAVGVSWATLFPDLDNIAREIRSELQLYPPPGESE